jgi:hypothetical protein
MASLLGQGQVLRYLGNIIPVVRRNVVESSCQGCFIVELLPYLGCVDSFFVNLHSVTFN